MNPPLGPIRHGDPRNPGALDACGSRPGTSGAGPIGRGVSTGAVRAGEAGRNALSGPGSSALTAPAVRSCHDCGKIQRLAALGPRAAATCTDCGASLRRTNAGTLDLGLALGFASLVFFVAGATCVLATVEATGQQRTATLLSGPAALLQQGFWELAALVLAVTVAAPAAWIGASLYVFVGLRLRRPPPHMQAAFAVAGRIRTWSMLEVFLVGYFVAYAKLGALVHIAPGPGFYALFGVVACMTAMDALLDRQAVWEAVARRAPAAFPRAALAATIAEPGVVCCPTCELACRVVSPHPHGPRSRCPRCGASLRARKPGSIPRTAALTFSALIFYVPANVFPVLTVIQLGRGSPSTIVGGVWELLHGGQWPLAGIVFAASVAVPVLKILGLASMLAVALRRRSAHNRQFTALYRVISVVGRWSMIDIFMESILAALVQFGAIATITPGVGALSFAAVVVLTMLAAESFDPRVLWRRDA